MALSSIDVVQLPEALQIPEVLELPWIQALPPDPDPLYGEGLRLISVRREYSIRAIGTDVGGIALTGKLLTHEPEPEAEYGDVTHSRLTFAKTPSLAAHVFEVANMPGVPFDIHDPSRINTIHEAGKQLIRAWGREIIIQDLIKDTTDLQRRLKQMGQEDLTPRDTALMSVLDEYLSGGVTENQSAIYEAAQTLVRANVGWISTNRWNARKGDISAPPEYFLKLATQSVR